jgi:predicted O-linked N-acetylglucosamine transferase (SPINDLY family)
LRAHWAPHAVRPDPGRRDPDRALTVGFVSADFNRHPVGFFVRGLFERLDARAAIPVCFALDGRADDVTAALRAAVPRWVDAAALDDAALAARIAAEGVDILVDLAGHTAGNRLPVFARKPAPVQLTWAGYVGTTGLAAIDWLVADRFHVPVELERDHVERVLRLPDGYVCYAPPAYAPPETPLPAETIFAAFHNPAKVGARAIALWARVLEAVPGARLLLKYKTMDSAANRARLAAGFAAHGIAAERLIIEGAVPHDRLLARYGDCAIALDSLPYSGGLTTLEALWMGVPVVTLPGRIFASRHSLSHLSNAGLTELVARDESDYVAIAQALAQDRVRLAALRSSLRARLAASPLLDHARFARGFETALRTAWHDWCGQK